MKHLALLIAAFIAPTCFAADKAIADKLVSTIGTGEVLEKITQACLIEARKTDVVATLESRPGLFGEIDPSSPVWEETKTAWIALVESNCYYLSKEKSLAAFSRAYAAGMTNSEIEQVLAFYKTPTGQKFRTAGIAASMAGNQEAADPTAGEAAYQQYLRKIEELRLKHQQLTTKKSGAR